MAKTIASEVAQKLSIAYKEVNLATNEGLTEGLAYDVLCTPSIALDNEIIVRGQLISKEKLEAEVRERIGKWRKRISEEQAKP